MTIHSAPIDRSTIIFRLAHLVRRWRQVLDNEFQSVGLTDATWRPLLHLHFLGNGIKQKDLAASVGIEGPSLVRLLDTLFMKGLILRTEDSSDRRAKLLSLTPEGREAVERIRETVHRVENELLAPLSDREIEEIATSILRLEATAGDLRQRGRR